MIFTNHVQIFMKIIYFAFLPLLQSHILVTVKLFYISYMFTNTLYLYVILMYLCLLCFPGKTRTKDKYRVVYTDHQRLELEKEFHYSRYITIRRKAELAQSLALSERQVKIWFQNRRAKERKQNKKREEAMGITGIKSERQDPMSPVNMLGGGGGVCGGVEGNAPSLHMGHLGHQGQQQQQQMSSQQILGAGVVVAPGAGSHDTTSLGVLQGPGSSGPHTPPMSTHSPPMTGHHS